MLLIACGAAPRPAVDGALTFRGPADTEKIEHLLAEIEAGEVRRVAFAVPAGAVWSLPVYELALLTAGWLAARGRDDVNLALVTPEDRAAAPVRRRGQRRGSRAPRGARNRGAHPGVPGGSTRGRAPAGRRGRSPRRSRRRASAAAGPADRRHPADVRGLHPRRPARTRDRHLRRVCGRRHHDVHRQAGRHRGPAGGGRRRVDRGRVGHRDRASAVPARAPRLASHG